MSKWTPYAIVTSKGKAVKTDVLEQYTTSQSKQLQKELFTDSQYTKDNLVKPLYEPLTMAKLMEINTYHMRACRTKAEDVAGNGWKITSIVENPDKSQKEKIENFINHQQIPLEETLKRLQLDKESVGYFAMEIARAFNGFDGEVDLISHIPAHTIRIHNSGNKYCQSRNNNKVWFRNFGYKKDIDSETGQELKETSEKEKRDKRANEVIWNTNYTPRSCFYGVPDVTSAIGAITGDISRRDYNIAFFSNFGVPAYLVSISGDFDPGEIDPKTGKTPMVENIEKKFKELVNNPQSVLILTIPKTETGQGNIEIKIEPLSAEVKEASFRLYRNDNRDEVIAAHGMPPYRMGIYETGSLAGNLGRESTVIYYSSIIQPRQNVFNHIFNQQILPTLGITDYYFELESIDLTEIDKDVERCVKLLSAGVMTPNDVIEYLGDYFGLEKDDDNLAMTFHYINGQAIDAGGLIPQSELTSVMNGVKDKLIEGLINYVSKNNDGNLNRDRRITKAISDLEKDIRQIAKGRN